MDGLYCAACLTSSCFELLVVFNDPFFKFRLSAVFSSEGCPLVHSVPFPNSFVYEPGFVSGESYLFRPPSSYPEGSLTPLSFLCEPPGIRSVTHFFFFVKTCNFTFAPGRTDSPPSKVSGRQ